MARIAVFCSSSTQIDPSFIELAGRVGSELARLGHDLVSGGGNISMMGAVAASVRAGGGHTLGVIPAALMPYEVADTDADELVVTATMRERKGRMDEAADAFLVLPGGIGTLEEFFEVWVARSLGFHAKPIVVLDPANTFAALHTLVDDLTAAGFIRPSASQDVSWARDCEQALEMLQTQLAELP